MGYFILLLLNIAISYKAERAADLYLPAAKPLVLFSITQTNYSNQSILH